MPSPPRAARLHALAVQPLRLAWGRSHRSAEVNGHPGWKFNVFDSVKEVENTNTNNEYL